MDEFALIQQLVKHLPSPSQRVEVGIGDDAAVCRLTPGFRLVTTIDMMVENRHFKTTAIPGRAVGYRLIAAGVSDLAAMGAVPRYACLSVGLPQRDSSYAYVEDIYRGVAQACRKWSVDVIGGDTVAAQQIILDACLMGEAPPASVVTRTNAGPGHLVAVTGMVGDSAAGLNILLSGSAVQSEAAAKLVERHCYPQPPVAFAVELARQGLISSCNDISDGLASELHEICDASEVGAIIEVERLPLSPELLMAAKSLEKSRQWALFGGEDYQLVFTVQPEYWKKVREVAAKHAVKVCRIGRIISDRRVVLRTNTGEQPLKKGGFNHFRW